MISASITSPVAFVARYLAVVPAGTELIFRVLVVVSAVAVTFCDCTNPDVVTAAHVMPFTPTRDFEFKSTLDCAPVYGTNKAANCCPFMVIDDKSSESSPFNVLGKTVLLTPLRDIPCY